MQMRHNSSDNLFDYAVLFTLTRFRIHAENKTVYKDQTGRIFENIITLQDLNRVLFVIMTIQSDIKHLFANFSNRIASLIYNIDIIPVVNYDTLSSVSNNKAITRQGVT